MVSNLTSSAIDKSDKRISGKGAVREKKDLLLFISYERMNEIIKIINRLKDLDVSIDGVAETVKDEIKI